MNQYQRLIDNLTKLNLNNMAESIADYRQQVNDSQISFSEALLELTDKEIDYQRQESLKRRIKRARFPIVKRLSDFNYQFLDNQENIIFIGSPGVGKTHLSIGIGIEACRQGVRTLFINCHELILRLKSAQEKQHLERVMRRYERYDLLIIDELGYLPISANESKMLFQLINGRYERKSTIITTNVPLSSWGTVLNSTATAEAILDRLVYHSHVIKIKGKSYRLTSVSS
ncbi:IstB ATP binding domain protein [Ligilactobacillus ruminis DPC 6832]|uniref:IstB ATP binding domain protein n=1 Tax=Ligilactobacillus ruminis DPC 6832 TaxID=1402208 RepID=A0A837DVB8_9LACO|nr:IS21-like element helper ATPase IstB [Ligilactobacillus ruminis]KIC04754.1 IstB ATP binding domain protein [Ligilactobacillus ruminis DPC 6832]